MGLTAQAILTIEDGTGLTVSGSQSVTANLTTAGEKSGGNQVLSTSWQNLATGAVASNEWTWLWIKNTSSTSGQDVYVGKHSPLGNLTKQGDVAGASLPATAAGGAGYFYDITADGNGQSVDWSVGDRAVYSGTSGVWFRIPVAEICELKPGQMALFRCRADSIDIKVKSIAGTPTIQYGIAGPLS